MRTPTFHLTRWVEHFRKNKEHREEPDWDAPVSLPPDLVQTLLPSLQQFELGDGGGPAYLIAWDREKFLSHPGARELVDLWFKEEEEHSRLLGDAVKRFGGESIEAHWSFSLFCGVRRYLGVRFELRALLLTEIVSNVYYQMLLKYGGKQDPALAQMCRLIIRDETGHIAFHRDWLGRSGGSYGKLWFALFVAMGFGAGTVLWVNHGKAIRTLGGTNKEFYRGIFRGMRLFTQWLRSGAVSAAEIPVLIARTAQATEARRA